MVDVMSEHIVGNLTHWVEPEYVDAVLNNKNDVFVPTIFNKPLGVWLSWNGGWEKWTESEAPTWLEGQVVLVAQLKPGFKLWLINEMTDFVVMWEEFNNHIGDTVYSMSGLYWCHDFNKMKQFWDWIKNVKGYGGIALTDAGQWATRMNTFLYGWDCQSIVIFDTNNIIFKRYATLIEDKTTTEEDTNGKREE